MREIAAYAVAPFDDLRRRNVRPARTETILDIVVNPIRNSLHAFTRIQYPSELLAGEFEQAIGIAITAGQKISEQRGLERGDRQNVSGIVGLVGRDRNVYQGIVANLVQPRLQNHSIRIVTVGIDKFL